MGKIFFTVGMSLEGLIAGLNGGPKNPMGDGELKSTSGYSIRKASVNSLPWEKAAK